MQFTHRSASVSDTASGEPPAVAARIASSSAAVVGNACERVAVTPAAAARAAISGSGSASCGRGGCGSGGDSGARTLSRRLSTRRSALYDSGSCAPGKHRCRAIAALRRAAASAPAARRQPHGHAPVTLAGRPQRGEAAVQRLALE